jgi:hypothetical protein
MFLTGALAPLLLWRRGILLRLSPLWPVRERGQVELPVHEEGAVHLPRDSLRIGFFQDELAGVLPMITPLPLWGQRQQVGPRFLDCVQDLSSATAARGRDGGR